MYIFYTFNYFDIHQIIINLRSIVLVGCIVMVFLFDYVIDYISTT
jgi:hypothetical protein